MQGSNSSQSRLVLEASHSPIEANGLRRQRRRDAGCSCTCTSDATFDCEIRTAHINTAARFEAAGRCNVRIRCRRRSSEDNRVSLQTIFPVLCRAPTNSALFVDDRIRPIPGRATLSTCPRPEGSCDALLCEGYIFCSSACAGGASRRRHGATGTGILTTSRAHVRVANDVRRRRRFRCRQHARVNIRTRPRTYVECQRS